MNILFITLLIFLIIAIALYFYVFKTKKYKDLPIATGHYLDLIANNYNIKRIPGETDVDFRIRIFNVITRIR